MIYVCWCNFGGLRERFVNMALPHSQSRIKAHELKFMLKWNMVQLSVEPRWKHISFQIWLFTIHLTVAFTLHLSCNSEAEATSSHMGFPMKNWMSKIWREGGHFSYLIQTYYYYLEQQAPLKQQRGINCFHPLLFRINLFLFVQNAHQ